MRRHDFLKLGMVVGLLLMLGVFIQLPKAHADAGDVITDGVFNSNSMNAGQIDGFLNSNASSCISTNNHFSTADPQGYSASSGQYTYGGSVSAGQAIYDIAAHYDVNPQVVLTQMQKEQSIPTGSAGCYPNTPSTSNLITDAGTCGSAGVPCTSACPYGGGCLPIALSYRCPGKCRAASEGFSNQLSGGVWLMRFAQERAYGNLTGYPGYDSGDENYTYAGPMTSGYHQRVAGGQSLYYDGTWTDNNGTTVHIANGATASLYDYTPFTSDTKFQTIFANWFGSPLGNQFQWSLSSINYSYDQAQTQPADSDHFMPYSRVLVTIKARNEGWSAWVNYGNTPVRIGTTQPTGRNSGDCDATWINCSRPAQMIDSIVYPGQTGTFQFWLDTGTAFGQHTEFFNLLAENQTYMNGGDLNLTYNVNTPYAWYPSSTTTYTDSSKAQTVDVNNMAPGTRYYQVLTVTNMGTQTWYNSGANPIRLAPNEPNERQSAFCDSTWISCSRVATMQESSVAPGQTATFAYWLKTPNGGGQYQEHYNLLAENIAWMPDLGTYTNMSIVPTYSWQPVSESIQDTNGDTVTSHFRPNTTYVMTVQVKNTGNATWQAGDVNLATTGPHDRTSELYNPSWLSTSRVATINQNIAPGGTATYTADITTPNKSYDAIHEQFGMVAENIAWMPDQNMFISMSIGSADYAWQYVGQYEYTDATGAKPINLQNSLKPNTSYFIIIKGLNTGSETWTKNVTNMGTDNPQNRTSQFQASNWISSTRPGTLYENNVPTGQVGTWGFWITTPSTPGTYNEGFGAVEDGTSWLNELGISFPIKVSAQ